MPMAEIKIGTKIQCLTVVRYAGKKVTGRVWECRCDCGKLTKVVEAKLRIGHKKSCGCLRLKNAHFLKQTYSHTVVDAPTTHPLNPTWRSMISRCYNANDISYKNYGKRGIKICDEWRSDFWQFVKDIGPKPSPAYTIDRINNDGNYELSNCKWATRIEQRHNQRNGGRLANG